MDAKAQFLEDRSASLTWALVRVARDAGVRIDAIDLQAALGLPLLICAVPSERRIGAWPMYARDVFASEAAGLFGIRLRELHPPPAARNLEQAAEFRQHFDASYHPLILRALEHRQPVLAWRGWRDEPGPTWGVIGDVSDEGVGFCGCVAPVEGRCSADASVVLEHPAAQVYVVEGIDNVVPAPGSLLRAALDRARTVLTARALAHLGIVNGEEALEVWRERRALAPSASSTDESGFVHSMGINLDLFAHFLERHALAVSEKERVGLQHLAAACRDGSLACQSWPKATSDAARNAAESELRAALLKISHHPLLSIVGLGQPVEEH